MMITRKTRLTSGLVAIIMLVTMLAAFVLPVTAEELEFPGVQQMEKLGRDSTSDWGINTPEDWRAAVALSKTGEDFAGLTLHFTADIDFDVDKSGLAEESEYVDTLVSIVDEKYVGFAGNINGHGHVIKNLYIEHDITTEGVYAGLVGLISAKNVVIRDLGIESGLVNVTGEIPDDKSCYAGVFTSYSTNPVTIANCWTGADLKVNVTAKEADVAPFGRCSGIVLVNSYNIGEVTASCSGTARADGLVDWVSSSAELYNCFSVCQTKVDQLFSTGNAANPSHSSYNPEFIGTLNAGVKNVYGIGCTAVTNRSNFNALEDIDAFIVGADTYSSGELASKLNGNYDATYDKQFGRKYYKVEDGKTVYAEDESEATFSLTLTKKLGDFIVETETSYYPATTKIALPAFKNYKLVEDYSWEIMIDEAINGFYMPSANVYMNFASSIPDWDLVQRLIEKYTIYVETGHVATMAKEAEVYELLSKLEMIYGMKDTLPNDLAINMIGQYAGEDLEFDLSAKEGLTYPNLPLMRFYGSGSKGDWLIKDVVDWRKAVELSAGTSFSGVTFHFANDIDFENIPVDCLGTGTAFKGSIHGHGYKVENLKIEHDVEEKGVYVGFIGCASSGTVIRDLNLASGTITVTNNTKSPSADKQNGKESYSGVFMGQGNGVTFANCWNNVDLIIEGVNSKWDKEENEEGELTLSGSIFGRKNRGKVINCINTGKIINNDKDKTGTKDSGGRASVFVEWHNGTIDIENGTGDIVYISNAYSTGGHKPGLSYQSSLVCVTKNETKLVQGDYFKNLYGVGIGRTDGHSASSKLNEDDENRLLDEGIEVTGELAWLMNLNYDTTYDAEYGRKYYTVKNGQTVFGTKQEQPVKINVKVDGEIVQTVYGILGTPLNLGSFYKNIQVVESYAATVNGQNELLINTLPNGLEMTINATFAAGLDYAELLATIQEMQKIQNKDEYISGLTTESMDETLAKVQAKTYASQAEVNEAVTLLNSYYRVVNVKSIRECPETGEMDPAYAVSSLGDLEYLSTIKDRFSSSHVIYITADIDATGWTKDTYPDIDGDVTDMTKLKASLSGELAPSGKAKIIGLTVSPNLGQYDTGWLGTYEGKSIKNLEFNKCSISYSSNTYTGILMGTYDGKTLTVSNVSMVDCTFDQGATSNGDGARGGGLIGRIYAGSVNFENILLTGNKVNKMGRQNIGTLFGYCRGDVGIKVTVKNVISSNNTYEFTHNASIYNYSPLIAEMNGDLTVENVGIFNNKTTAITGVTREKNSAVICGYTTATKSLKISNVLAYGNNLKTTYVKGAGATVVPEEKNVFVVYSGSDTTLETITSGKALYEINATNPGKRWAIGDSDPVFSTTGTPHKVTFDFTYNEDVVLYTDNNGKLIGLTKTIKDMTWDGYTDLANKVFTEDTVIKQAVCDHKYAYTFDGIGKHKVKCSKNCGYEETQDCTLELQVGNGTTHKKVCSVCKGEISENCTKVMNHIYGTYEGDSKHSEACTVCGYASAETACTFTDKKVEHTDSMNGYTRRTCDCGYFYDMIESTKNHVRDTENKVVVKENTNGEDGLVAYPCKYCSAVEYETVAAETITETSIVLNSTVPYSKLPGEKFEVDVVLAQNPGVNGINMMVEYDPEVLKLDFDAFKEKYYDSEAGKFTHDKFSVFLVSQEEGKLRLTFLNLPNVTDLELPLFTLTFEVLNTAELGVTDINVTLVKDATNPNDTGASNYAGENIPIKDAETKFEVVKNLWADVNGDGAVNTIDATMILQWKVGNTFNANEFDLKAADADRNGIIEIADAVMILQYAVGMVEWDPNGTTKAPATL